jgi:hypothetical protein
VHIPRPTARTVYRDAATLFREHFGVIVGIAALVLVPFAVLDAVGVLRVHIESGARAVEILLALLTVAVSGISGLASIFYAGLLDHASAAWHRGEATPAPGEIARRLPWFQLVVASVLWFVLVAVGLILAIVPGLVALTLFSLTGPVLVREELSAVAALRRSARLVWRRPFLVVLTAVIPYLVEVYLADLAGELFGHSVPIELTVEVLATLFLASFVGVLEVVTAHQLIATERS